MKIVKKRKILATLAKYQDATQAIVLTGFRRVGKTTVMREIYDALPTKNKLYLDLESLIYQRMFADENYDNFRLKFEAEGLNFEEKAYVFLDEIQNVKNLPSIVKYLHDHLGIKFYLTGSSSFYLKNYFSESMSGRKFLFELMPLDFEEFLWFKDQNLSLQADYDSLIDYYREYLQYGGLPAVVLAQSKEEKIINLDDALSSYFRLDVNKLANFHDNQKLKELLFLLAFRVGAKPEMVKLSESLGVTRQTIGQYLSFFEQTYLINFLRPLSGSSDITIKSMPKVYFGDTGLLNRVGQVGIGHVFENKIFNELHTKLVYEEGVNRLNEGLNYYQTKSGLEIDFVYKQKIGFEIKNRAGNFDVLAAKKAAAKAGLEKIKVVSLVKTEKEGIITPWEVPQTLISRAGIV